MRWMLFVVATLSLAGAVTAHEGEHDCGERNLGAFNHLGLWEATLEPGQNMTRTLGFDGCPLAQDWWMLFWIESDGVHVDVAAEGQPIASWTTTGTDVHTAKMPVTGYPELTVRNDGSQNASFALYFDQTCDCTAKGVVRNGPVFLNIDAGMGDRVRFDLRVLPFWAPIGNEPELPESVRVRLTPMVALGAILEPVPEAAKTLTFRPADEPGCDNDLESEGCTSMSWEVTIPGMQVLWVEVLEGADEGWTVMILPVVAVQKDAPLAWWTLPVALVAVAMARQTLSRRGRPGD